MKIFSFHLVETTPITTAKALMRPPTPTAVAGLHHVECMSTMQLGAPVVSPSRLQLKQLSMFASWESEQALDAFLSEQSLGQKMARGWHVRLQFLRRWGHVAAFDGLGELDGEAAPDEPVVAFTLARMKLPQLPRFISWGRPVETLVRDDPEQSLALAGLRMPRTVSTFSVWKSAGAMENMVRGHSNVNDPSRHLDAMTERTRKDFHFEFTTLRFRCLSEHGSWQGRTRIVPES